MSRIAIIALFLVAACKKERTCTCDATQTSTSSTGPAGPPFVYKTVTKYPHSRKSLVVSCVDQEVTQMYPTVTVTTVYDCKLE